MDWKLLQGESKYIEYKQDYTKTFLKTVSAFANYHDGYIVFGIDDDGKILGTQHLNELKLSIENAINDNISPKPYYELYSETIDDKKIAIIKVYQGDHTPYTIKGNAYKRLDTSTVQVDRHGYEELILLGRNQSFENLKYSYNSLTFNYLSTKLKQILKVHNLTEDLLITLGLKEKGIFNNAAALLSDNNPITSSTLQLISYNDHTVKSIKDRQTLENISILQQFDYAIDFYRKHINVSEIIEGAYRKTVEEIPLVAYREAVTNLIIHRDYAIQADARVEIFSDRVEILSPGGPPIGISEEEYKEGRMSIPRNKILADIFLRLKIIEKLATGIRRIKGYYSEYNAKPDFIVTENSILVILPKVQTSKDNNANYLNSIIHRLNDKENQIVKLLTKRERLTRKEIEDELGLKKSQTIDLIKHLRDLDVVKQIGRGRSTFYILNDLWIKLK